MSVAGAYFVGRSTLGGRVRDTSRRLVRRPKVMIVIAVVGLLGTFEAMVATGGPGRIGTIWFVPWVALLASQLGPAGGAASGVAAAVLYFVGAEVLTDSDDPVAVVLKFVPLLAVGVAAGYSSRRIAADSREIQATAAVQRALLDSTLDGICLTDLSGRLLFANAPLQEISLELGLPPDGTVTERLLALAGRTTEPLASATACASSPRTQRPAKTSSSSATPGASTAAPPHPSPGRTEPSSAGSGRCGR